MKGGRYNHPGCLYLILETDSWLIKEAAKCQNFAASVQLYYLLRPEALSAKSPRTHAAEKLVRDLIHLPAVHNYCAVVIFGVSVIIESGIPGDVYRASVYYDVAV